VPLVIAFENSELTLVGAVFEARDGSLIGLDGVVIELEELIE